MTLDPKKTAMLTLDLQKGILGMFPDTESVLPGAQRAVEFARKKDFFLVHVGLGFSEGHPEIPNGESLFSRVKQNNLFVKGSASAEFHGSVIQRGDLIVYKQRVSAFSQNHLQMILRSQGIEHLVLFGVATSGIVLSTVREAFDLDYGMTVLKDACFDSDPEVHHVLTEKVFPRQATVSTVDDFITRNE
jgi:nicotinamidase-related amidase